MARRFAGERLILATHNAGKLAEFRALLAPAEIDEIASLAELGLPEPEETSESFAGNARLKAVAAVRATGLPALADDSGLEVRGLDGRPGVHSARWAGPGRDFAPAFARIRSELSACFGSFEAADTRAAFVAVLCLAWPDGHAELFEGWVEGRLVAEPRGANGFGYDPIFVPEGETRTFGEMTRDEKARFSHRARAVAALRAACFSADPCDGG